MPNETVHHLPQNRIQFPKGQVMADTRKEGVCSWEGAFSAMPMFQMQEGGMRLSDNVIRPHQILVQTDTPDPTNAIAGFLWNMEKARQLGMMPCSAHLMAEHFFKGDVQLVFYSSCRGTIALAADDDALDADESFEVMKFVMESVAKRRKRRRAELEASAGEAGTAETTEIGSAEGERAVPKADAQEPSEHLPDRTVG